MKRTNKFDHIDSTFTMLSKEQLLKQIQSTLAKTKVLELTSVLHHKHFKLRDLIELTFFTDKKIAFRAAWLLENLFLHRPDLYVNDLPFFIEKFPRVDHASCKRHYAKIAMHVTSPHASAAIRNKISNIDMQPVVDTCFEWMIDANVLVAVKAFAGEALFNLRHRYPWITDELSAQLEYLMRNGTAAIQTKGKKLLAFMHPLIH
jgi:hypothetical protein